MANIHRRRKYRKRRNGAKLSRRECRRWRTLAEYVSTFYGPRTKP